MIAKDPTQPTVANASPGSGWASALAGIGLRIYVRQVRTAHLVAALASDPGALLPCLPSKRLLDLLVPANALIYQKR
jgi:hypothetical protein